MKLFKPYVKSNRLYLCFVVFFVTVATFICGSFLIGESSHRRSLSVSEKMNLKAKLQNHMEHLLDKDKIQEDTKDMDTGVEDESDGSIPKETAEKFEWCPKANETEYPDCDALFDAKRDAITSARGWKSPCPYSDDDILKMATSSCDDLVKNFQFPNDAYSKEEKKFPLAFAMLVVKNAEQVVRLLSSIYQPQNAYCITYDLHSKGAFTLALEAVAKCFPKNVWIPSIHREVEWAEFSIVEATVDCLKVLDEHQSRNGWQYVQILSWNDLPLKTNLEMVKILKLYDGASDAELSYGQIERYRTWHERDPNKTKTKNSVPPNGLTIYKSSYAVTMHADFVRFILTDKTAKIFYEWSSKFYIADEQFWATLIHNNHLNQVGQFPGNCLHYYKFDYKGGKEHISRHQVWEGSSSCHGKIVRASCVFGVGDLALLKKQPHLIAHKFYIDFEPAVLYCMQRRLFEKNRQGIVELNMPYYENLPAVRYRRMKDKNAFTCQ